MSNYSVSASQIQEGSIIAVRGKINFSRLANLVQGEELIQSDNRRTQNGMYRIGVPHTTVSLTEPQVVMDNPAAPTKEQLFVQERFYVSKKNPEVGPQYSIDSRSNTLPVIAIPSTTEPGKFEQDTSRQELAQGVDVTLVLRVYKPKEHLNRGLTIEQVIVNETPRYYNSATRVPDATLAALGVTFVAKPEPIQASEPVPANVQVPSAGENPAFASDPATAGMTLPGPQTVIPQPAEQAPAAPVAQPAPPAPVTEETITEKLARLEAENAAMKAGGGHNGSVAQEQTPVPAAAGGSAFGDPADGPWGNAPQAGITYQG